MKKSMTAPDIRSVKVTDRLFGSYAALVSQKILPYQWEILNDRVAGATKSYCVQNFRIAAGEFPGVHQGAVFCDTDAYKWLEAVAYCIENGTGEAFIPIADELIALIGRAQQADGYLNTYYTIGHPEDRWTNLAEGHELYGAGYLIEAAVAYYRATGKDALLNMARRFADLIDDVFGEERGWHKGYPGHQEIELALVKLYRATGEARYLALAKHFVDVRGRAPNYLIGELKANAGKTLFPEFHDYDAEYAQSHLPPAQQTTAEGHAVRAMYLYSAMADLAAEFGDAPLKSACKALWENVTAKRMYITGGLGASGLLERFTTDYDLPNERMYCESCASVGLMMFGQRMAALTREARYYEAVERALCNTVLAGIAMTGDRYFYVNPLEVWPANCLPSTSMAHVKPRRQQWFSVACCPTNIARTLASLGQYIYAQDERSIYVNLFVSSQFSTAVQGADVRLTLDSTYMLDGKVRLTVDSAAAKPFTIRVRIPAYFKEPCFSLGGAEISPVVENGYAVIAISRAGEQTFTLQGTVQPAFVAANEQVRADAGKVALMMGPYVYCLEQADNGGNLANLFASPHAAVSPGRPVEGLPGGLPSLSFDGVRLTRSIEEAGALYGTPAFQSEAARLTALPYCLWGNREAGEMLVWLKAIIC